jgi:phenylacetate-coenzyme A ligase PaaK-like adenylate-forming protein
VNLGCTPSAAVRVCASAREHGLDISGTVFILSSEPYSESKRAIVEASGCRGVSIYGMMDLGQLGIPCAAPSEPDDVHLRLDRAAFLERPRLFAEKRLDVLFVTSLLSHSPKLLLNTESGDYGVFERRDCGCPLDELGLDLHLHTIRSHEKLTSEGVTFYGEDLVRLVESVLPGRFGGGPTDYQLVEEERDGLTKLSLVVSPHLGATDKEEAVRLVLETLAKGGRGRAYMATVWRDSRTPELVRGEPYVTSAHKILPLHVLRSREPSR